MCIRDRLKGWDERNGGNLTLRLDEADIEPYAADFHAKPRYIALSQPMPTLANQPFICLLYTSVK